MKEFDPLPENTNIRAKAIVDSALKGHKVPGPGLLESIYMACLRHELNLRGMKVETMKPVFEAQLLSYLKLAGKRLGLLIDFNVIHIKDGIKRMILMP